MTTDEERGLWAAVAGGIAADLSVYADWLADSGGRHFLEHALRWCVARGKRPHLSPGGKVASWRPLSHRLKPAADRLPRVVYDQMTGGKLTRDRRKYGAQGGYPPVIAAYVNLGLALRRLLDAYEYPA